MKTRTFWQIAIKLLGIYLLLSGLPLTTQPFIQFLIIFRTHLVELETIELLLTLVALVIYVLVLLYTIFKTDWIINKFKLDEHTDEDTLQLNFLNAGALRMAVVIIGGVTFVDILPSFFHQLFLYFQNINLYDGFKKSPYSAWLIDDSLKLLIAYLLIVFNKPIVDFIKQRTNKSVS